MMSSVAIPTSVTAGGTLACNLHLQGSDARVFVDRLRFAVERLIQRRGGGGSGSGGGGSAAPPVAAAPPPAAAAVTAAPVTTAAVSSVAPSSTTVTAVRAPPPLFPGAVPASAPQQPRPAAAAAAAPPRQPPPAGAPQQRAAAFSGPPVQAPRAAATASGPSWELCWTTDAADHNDQVVSSMVHVPQIAGLPGGDGHAGWLISSSRGLLNLWEASPSGGRGEPALMCMHSQGTDYTSVCLDAERSTRMLMSASVDRSGSEWVTCHSLDVESLLAPKGRCPMPHNAHSRISGQNCLAVASLHSFGGPLAETCVSAYGGALVVWSVGNANKPVASNASKACDMAPKALWKAHDALITSLHKSPFSLCLFSGDAAGKVHMFSMREKPSKPNAVFTHQGRITGIHQINESQLMTTAGDGAMMVWDIRSADAGPIKFAVPDSKPIVKAALSPFADSVAVATTAGIHMVDLVDAACTSTPIVKTIKSPVTALTWNAATLEVVAAGGGGPAGTISVFKARIPGY